MKITKKSTERYYFHGMPCAMERLKFIAAKTLNEFKFHKAGGGSKYVYIGDLKIRFADHENISTRHEPPDYNIVNRKISESEISEIEERVAIPKYCMQRAFGMHVGLTLQKVKKLVPENCYEEIVLNPKYTNTFTKVIKPLEALPVLEDHGYSERIPIRQETYSVETFWGYY